MSPAFSRNSVERLLVAAAFFLTLFFFGPARVFLRNRVEFSFAGTALLLLVALACLAAALAWPLLNALPDSVSLRVLALMLALAALLWLQGDILAWNYGLLDGRDIPWRGKTALGMIDGFLWLALLGFALFRARFVRRLARPLALGLITVQLLALLAAAAPRDGNAGPKRYVIDHDREFAFSSDRNIIIIVLDTFSTDLFHELVDENPGWKNDFAGFTYFRNALGGSPTTCTAIPMILAAKAFENKMPMKEFIRETYTGDSLPRHLKKAGYRCDLFPLTAQEIYLDPRLASNLGTHHPLSLREIAFLVDLGLFRQAPHFLKKVIYNKQQWLLSRAFEDAIPGRAGGKKKRARGKKQPIESSPVRGIRIDTARPVFKFFHRRGIHPPLTVRVDGQLQRLSFQRSSLKLKARQEIREWDLFLRQLKRIGAFRNSLIFLVGDHGPGNWGIVEIGRSLPGTGDRETASPVLKKIMAGALPLMLVKPMGGAGDQPLVVSDSPACLGDIPATAAAAAGLAAVFPGQPLFAKEAPASRERRYLYHEGFFFNKRGYIKAIFEYRVCGPGWQDASWQASGRIFLSPR